jgi:amino acid transporter
MKRKYRLANRKRFILFVMVISMVLYFAGMIVSAGAASNDTALPQYITVAKGDTLWEIASSHCTSGDIRAYVYDIKTINSLKGDTIYEGQTILLP